MFGDKANVNRTQRYDRWLGLLEEELELVATHDAKIFAVGSVVRDYLELRGRRRPHATLMHYSSIAAPHRARAVVGREHSFEEFKNSMTPERLRTVAESVLDECDVPQDIRNETLRKIKLSNSLLQLAFSYKLSLGAELDLDDDWLWARR
jgi:hypothetical protein